MKPLLCRVFGHRPFAFVDEVHGSARSRFIIVSFCHRCRRRLG